MDSTQTKFLILNAFIVTIVVLSFFVLRRAPKGPVKLELRDADELKSDLAREVKEAKQKPAPKFKDPRQGDAKAPTGWGNYQPRNRKIYGGVAEPAAAPAPTPAAAQIKAPQTKAKTPPLMSAADHEANVHVGPDFYSDDEVTNPGFDLGRTEPEKDLNVFFNWNGHTWDAFEVLGLPAGSSHEAVNVAYERASTLADKETEPFLKAALTAIQKG